jgi:hypothetical protein
MKKYVTQFREWSRIVESEPDDVEQQIADLRQLADLGMIDPLELKAALRKKGASAIIEYMPEYKEILNSPEYRELQERGLELVSSKTQLLNGSILFSRPGFRPKDGYAIGLFPGPMLIRRITPKGIQMGIYGRRYGSMDVIIKKLNFIPPQKFYRVAMRWILDHIDFDDPHFSVKQYTRKDYFDQF